MDQFEMMDRYGNDFDNYDDCFNDDDFDDDSGWEDDGRYDEQVRWAIYDLGMSKNCPLRGFYPASFM